MAPLLLCTTNPTHRCLLYVSLQTLCAQPCGASSRAVCHWSCYTMTQSLLWRFGSWRQRGKWSGETSWIALLAGTSHFRLFVCFCFFFHRVLHATGASTCRDGAALLAGMMSLDSMPRQAYLLCCCSQVSVVACIRQTSLLWVCCKVCSMVDVRKRLYSRRESSDPCYHRCLQHLAIDRVKILH